MSVLITRPAPANQATAARLCASGYEVLFAPMLRYEPVALPDDIGDAFGAVLVTSANAIRAINDHPIRARIKALPVFAVGEQTAVTARAAGFTNVTAADGDARSLCSLILNLVKTKQLKKSTALLYLAAADMSCDLAAVLGGHGLDVTTHTVYRMIALPTLAPDVSTALAEGTIGAILHYSRRSASAFVDAVRAEGVEISALALPQCCISANVADVVREAGAHRVAVAQSPDEPAMLQMLERTLPPPH